jgi:leucyl aminopeptidase (aminopeptidase T)
VKRVRLDSLLSSRGLFESRSRAAASVLAGDVLLLPERRRASKPGQLVPEDIEIEIVAEPPFVSRGGVKLANALDVLAIEVTGRRGLDVGASTGGFTDCLLQRGAAHVVAVDVAYGEPALVTRAATARKPIREARLTKRWCVTIWPTPALAQQARMSEPDYTEFVERALFLDRPDPVAAWRALSERQAALVEQLSGAHEIRIVAEGTDLTLRVEGRTWINSDGRRNMPSGEVFTGPIEDSATGRVRFDVPSSARGAEVSGVELKFEHGEVVAARADRGDEQLQAALATDAGARVLGELGIGTNPGIDRATGSTLLDEKIAGTVHLALGRSYPETGGKNASALHWDLICDLRRGGRLIVDGEELGVNA